MLNPMVNLVGLMVYGSCNDEFNGWSNGILVHIIANSMVDLVVHLIVYVWFNSQFHV